ncbi:MAG: hypothetical protein EOO07_15775 [Chitinophagaceae bacterium]|nr:MAG: hypothetical protein EOO07_15775 [Chitinophagaceae bacterium]
MKNKIVFSFISIAVALLAYLTFMTPAGANSWYLLVGNGFVIPNESSILTFEVTKMNEGSGEWWLYGQDEQFYYHFLGENGRSYIKIAKVNNCNGFNPHDSGTWCS